MGGEPIFLKHKPPLLLHFQMCRQVFFKSRAPNVQLIRYYIVVCIHWHYNIVWYNEHSPWCSTGLIFYGLIAGADPFFFGTSRHCFCIFECVGICIFECVGKLFSKNNVGRHIRPTHWTGWMCRSNVSANIMLIIYRRLFLIYGLTFFKKTSG